ncbi:ATP-binding cassette domain-containing protein [Streptomyces sp. GS7]|uniref:ATP-binding cassette domain-containing protein n=1 Tax=Streptomyces sp. GS7 TaxID=2692234 RepID=UPI0013162F1B|nr:ATP-binding cassette domain-containing protein [Streptomyces sp. GS7]QHC24489.1 ATP-binding cassette domain-containing protein [Streptomyces sp. GS7]
MYHLTGVTKCYRDGGDVVRALDGIGLYVEDGGTLVLQGPPGGGRSTLLRILAGLERPTHGSVELDGTDLATVTESRLARIRTESIGLLGPGPDAGLVTGLTARQNVSSALVPLRLHPADRWELAGDALDEVGLSGHMDFLPGELDAQARRRAALARALVKRPTALLADRPTAGLPAAARAEFTELLARLWSERRLTCVIATEDDALARRAPRRVTLARGTVTTAGNGDPQGAGAARPAPWCASGGAR